MMNSPQKVPPSRRSSTQGQLLDELEALSQALYKAQAQQKSSDQYADAPTQGLESDSTPVFTKKPLSHRETLPARRFSSYEPSKDASAIPLPGLAPALSSPVPSVHPASRHSISTGHMPTASFESKPVASTSRPRFTSTTLPSQPLPSWGEEVSDVRSRTERRGAPQLQQLRSPDRFASEEFDWPDDGPDVSSKLEPASGDKKKSFWNWKPLRAISHIGRQRYYCVFSAYVHAVKGLPPAMNGLRLSVHVRKEETKEGAVQTMPSRVFQGVAEFEETLYLKCSVYGSKGPSNTVKFMSRAFIVSLVAPDVEELDLGKHQFDLSRLLPENVDEKRGEMERGNSWNTSLELSGKAKGGKLVITFNYELLDKDVAKSSSVASKFQGSSARRRSSMQTSYSLPNSAHGTPRTRTANAYANLSPSVSEPGNDFNNELGMDLLNLDDPTEEVKGAPQHTEVQYYPSINSQLGTPAGSTVDPYNAFDNFEPRLKASDRELAPTPGPSTKSSAELLDVEDYASENEQEFTVEDKGMEIDEPVNVFTNEKESGPDGLGMEGTSQGTKSPQQYPVKQEEDVPADGPSTADNDAPEAEKKESVTYQMVMKTLESLLQGTSAKERAHLEMLEGRSELETLLEESSSIVADTKQAQKAVLVKIPNNEPDSSVLKASKVGKVEAEEKVTDDGLDQEVNEFLHMLEAGGPLSDVEVNSPRAQLLKQFEEEAGGFGLDLSPSKDPRKPIDNASPGTDIPDMRVWSSSSRRPSATMAPESKAYRTTHGPQNKIKESPGEAADWKERSLPKNTPKPPEPPPLGKGLGASITIKGGGTLRSMNPMLFQSESCTGKLVMQVSKPVILPAEMGSGTVDVLRNMASMGIENMALQAMTAMPLEELIGTSIEQIALEGLAAGKASRIRGALGGPFRLRSTVKQAAKTSQQLSTDNKDAYVSLENLAPTAMQQLEYLAMDGLKIQAGMTDEEAPYALNAFSMEGQGGGDGSPHSGNTATLKGVTGVHLLKGAKVPAQTVGGAKGLMDMAITLDEWMLLDAGSYNEAENSKDAMAIMAAHGAVKDLRRLLDPKSKGTRWGCMGNTLSIGMLVQLRDPLRGFEPIGVPMIAFVEAERVVLPTRSNGEAESLFKITGVHMAGLRASPESRRPGWGSQRQLRAATRWLLANGMSRPKGAMAGKSRDALWSISAQLLGSGDKWKDLTRYNSHVRNPDVLYEHQNLMTR